MAKRLHFGVPDNIHYAYGGGGKSVHEVAEILEARYAIIERFVADNDKPIRALMKEQSARHARAAVAGRTPSMQPALDKIKQMFKTYLLTKQLDGKGIGGFPIPTLASLRGVNHRLKHPYARRAPRPSFVDTGLYMSAFKAWVE